MVFRDVVLEVWWTSVDVLKEPAAVTVLEAARSFKTSVTTYNINGITS
jgi:hypothetical protein